MKTQHIWTRQTYWGLCLTALFHYFGTSLRLCCIEFYMLLKLKKLMKHPLIQQSVAHGLHDIYYSKPVSEPKAFFNKYVKISEDAYQVLATRTVNLSNRKHSSLWHDSRKLRIPSSKLAAVPKTERADQQKFVKSHLYPRFKGTADTRHCTLSEPKVRKYFESECLGGRN